MRNCNYIVKSLELHLLFGRIMKELTAKEIRLRAGECQEKNLQKLSCQVHRLNRRAFELV